MNARQSAEKDASVIPLRPESVLDALVRWHKGEGPEPTGFSGPHGAAWSEPSLHDASDDTRVIPPEVTA